MLSAILDALFPPVCHLCDENLTRSERFLCSSCIDSLPRTRYHTIELNPVEMRFAGKFKFERATSHFFYAPGNSVAALVHDFKYRSYPSLARQLGRIAAQELLMAGWLDGIDLACPVPLHWWKQTGRGYNQSEEIAKGICDVSDIEMRPSLKALKAHRSQTSFSHSEREANVNGIFRLVNPEQFEKKTILLVDDVCTTGATLTAAAEAILKGQPDCRLAILTLAATF